MENDVSWPIEVIIYQKDQIIYAGDDLDKGMEALYKHVDKNL